MFTKEVTQKNKDGSTRKYLYLMESRRVDGKPRHFMLVNLGRIDSDEGKEKLESLTEALLKASSKFEIFDAAKNLQGDWSKEFGPALVFKRLWEELGLGKVLTSELKDLKTQFETEQAVFNMVLNRLTEPGSKRQLCLWQDNTYGINSFEEHQYYRAMDHLIEHKDKIELGIFDSMRNLFNQEIDVCLFDTTTLVYYGDSEKHEKLLQRGFSKVKRGDLKQVVVGIIMSKDGVPLGHEVFSGNTNDVQCFKEIIEKVSEKFKIRKVVLVGDRGMISQKNIDHLESKKFEYILGYRMRTISKEERHKIFSHADLKEVRKNLQFKELNYKGNRLFICFNPERAELDKNHREDILEKIRKRIRDGSILSVISNKDYKRFLKIEGKKPKLDDVKISQDEIYDGVYVLTSNTELKPEAIIDSYRDLWQVEQAFRQLKSEIEMGPIFHWKDRRIKAHIMICFLALILRNTFYKELKAISKDASYPEVINDLKQLQALGLKIKNKNVILRTELKAGASLAFKAIGMRPPEKILLDEAQNVCIRL